MGLFKDYVSQTRKPEGFLGKMMLSGMNSAKGMFKKDIAKALKVRRIPELIFRMDKAAEYGRHIDEILSTLPFDEYHAVDPNEVPEDEEEL